MRAFFCVLMLFVARQATAYSWHQLIDSQKDLCVYFNGGLQGSRYDGADSLKTKWSWGRPGVKFSVYSLDSIRVFKAMLEGEIADSSLTSVYIEQELKFPGYSYKLRAGHFLSPAMNIIPPPIKRKTMGAPEATRRFTGYVPGGMFSAEKQMDAGSFLLELALFERSKPAQYDPMFTESSGFDELPNGKDVRRFAYRLELKSDALGKLEAGFEQDVGHIFAATGSFGSWFEPRLGMSSFQRKAGESRLSVFFAESTIWVTEKVALTGRLDFGDEEVDENSQFGLFWQHQKENEGDGKFGLFWQPSTETVSLLLSGSIDW